MRISEEYRNMFPKEVIVALENMNDADGEVILAHLLDGYKAVVRASIPAIMVRNMSHNIGSSIFTRFQKN